MKKSEIYRRAQIAVLHTRTMTADEKLEVLREFMEQEDFGKFKEDRDDENA